MFQQPISWLSACGSVTAPALRDSRFTEARTRATSVPTSVVGQCNNSWGLSDVMNWLHLQWWGDSLVISWFEFFTLCDLGSDVVTQYVWQTRQVSQSKVLRFALGLDNIREIMENIIILMDFVLVSEVRDLDLLGAEDARTAVPIRSLKLTTSCVFLVSSSQVDPINMRMARSVFGHTWNPLWNLKHYIYIPCLTLLYFSIILIKATVFFNSRLFFASYWHL